MKLLFAYLDAGTGSLVVQAVIGGIVAIGVFVKTFWSKLTSPFRKKTTDSSSTDKKPASTTKSNG